MPLTRNLSKHESKEITDKDLKLVHITTVPESLEFVRGQIAFMQDHGLFVQVISSPDSDLDRFAETTNARAFGIKMPRKVTPLRDIFALAKLLQLLLRHRPHIVHAHTPKAGMLGMVASWLAGIPVRIYQMHGLPLETATGLQRKLLKLSEWTACRCATSVLSVSHSVREVALSESLCQQEKIKVLLSGSVMGVDALSHFNPANIPPETGNNVRTKFGIPIDAPVIGFVGRLVRDKGIIELFEAWKILRASYPNLHLLMIGSSDSRDALPFGILEALRKDPSVHFTGFTSPLPYYSTMDLLVLPTYREGLPTVLLEASAMELPVVATNVTGCVDAVEDGVTGTLVPIHDADSLQSAIAVYLESAELRRKHGRGGREFVLDHYKPQAVWSAMLKEYYCQLSSRGIELPEELAAIDTQTEEPVL